MATISITSDLDVAEKYETLVKQSLAGNSAYIRAKETIQELVDSGSIDETQKAEIISSVVGGIINNITSSSMSTAMSWANAEKEIALKKLELAKQLDILDQEILVKEKQVSQLDSSVRLAKVESKRMYGTATFDTEGNVQSLANDGKVYKDMLLTDAQISKAVVEQQLIDQKINESYAAVHKIMADSLVNYGAHTYTISATGASSTSGGIQPNTLSYTQQQIAEQQAKGYTYNAWANALTGSASMLGTAMASDIFDFSAGTPGATFLDNVVQITTNLKNTTTP